MKQYEKILWFLGLKIPLIKVRLQYYSQDSQQNSTVYLKFVSENEEFLSGKVEMEENFLEAKESSSGERSKW